MQDTILKIQNISKFYPGVTALNNVSFEIKAGEARCWKVYVDKMHHGC